MSHELPWLVTLAELSEIEEVVVASHEVCLPRMDKPPAPRERDYAGAIENGQIWVVGDSVEGLVSFVTRSGGVR